jgi:LL-diaminopimelate aminotransferase
MTFVTRVLEEASVVLIPGNGFGKPGEGYFRAALTVELDRINEAIDRIKRIKW